MLRVLQQRRVPLSTSAGVVAQVWRDGRKQPLLAKVLAGVAVRGLTPPDDKATGELLAAAGSRDVVDAHLVLCVEPGDTILTGDRDDIQRLVSARRVPATLVHT